MWIKKEWIKFTELGIIGKIRQIIWIMLLALLIIPATRRSILSNVHRYFANVPTIEPTDILTDEEWNWRLENEEGQIISLSDLQGKTIFLNFWATWCPNCIAEFTDIETMYQKYGDRVAFVMLSQENMDVLSQFKEEKNYTFPVYHYRFQVPTLFKHRVIPTTYIIDSTGQMRSKETGTADWNAPIIHTLFDELLSINQ